MSKEVEVLFEVRSKLIMKETLEQLGIEYEEIGPILNIKQKYSDIKIDSKVGLFTYDSANKKLVDKICQNYTINFYKNKAIKEGNKFTTEKIKNEIIMHITR